MFFTCIREAGERDGVSVEEWLRSDRPTVVLLVPPRSDLGRILYEQGYLTVISILSGEVVDILVPRRKELQSYAQIVRAVANALKEAGIDGAVTELREPGIVVFAPEGKKVAVVTSKMDPEAFMNDLGDLVSYLVGGGSVELAREAILVKRLRPKFFSLLAVFLPAGIQLASRWCPSR